MATIKWGLDDDGDWSVAANWIGGATPGATDTVWLKSVHAHVVAHSAGSDTIGRLNSYTDQLAVSGGALAVQAGSALGQAVSVTGGALILNGATNTASGAVAVSGAELRLGAGARFTVNGSMTIGSAINQFIPGGTIDGAGTLATRGATSFAATLYRVSMGGGLTWTNSGVATLASGILVGTTLGATAAFVNAASGTITLTGDGIGIEGQYVTVNGTSALGASSFVNAGLLAKAGGTGTSVIDSALTSTGRIQVASGTLDLHGGGALGGTIGGAGAVLLHDGAFTLDGPRLLTGAALILGGGTLAIGAGRTVSNVALVSGEVDGAGTVANAGSLTLAASPGANGAVLTLGGGVVFENSGTVSMSSGGIAAGDRAGLTASLSNLAGGVFEFTGDASISDGYYYSGGYVFGSSGFFNAGLLEKTGGSGISVIASRLVNAGTISVTSGTLQLTGGGTLGGSIGGGGALLLAGGAFVLDGPTIAADTAFVLSGGTIAIAGGSVLAGLTFTAGRIDGPGGLLNDGSLTLDSAGLFAAPVLTLGGGLTFRNAGVLELSNGGIQVGDDAGLTADLVNAAGATFRFTGDASITDRYIFSPDGSLYGSSTFLNAGLLQKSGGDGLSVIASVLVNHGTIDVATGAIALNGGGTLGGTISGAGTLLLGQGRFTLDHPTILGGASIFLAGGTIAVAAGATLGTIGLISGEIDGPGTFATGGAVGGSYVTLGGSATWANGGTASVIGLTFGDDAGGAARLANLAGAALRVGVIFGGGDGGRISNAGLLEISAGYVDHFYGVFDNAGTVQVDVADLELHGGGALSGTLAGAGVFTLVAGGFAVGGLREAAGAMIVLAGGAMTLAAGQTASLAGAFIQEGGAIRLAAGSVLSAFGTASFGVDYGAAAHVDGPGTLALSGPTYVAETDYTDGVALRLGGGAVLRNSGSLTDAGFIRVGDGFGLKAGFVNTSSGVFNLISDDAGIGANAVLSPTGIFRAGSSTFANNGRLEKTGGDGRSFITSAVTNNGTIVAGSGTLDFTSKIGGATGTLRIAAGATLETVGFTSTQALAFDGAGTLLLDAAQSVSRAIAGFGAGAAIDLSFAAGAVASISGNTLSITPTGGAAMAFVSAASLAGTVATVAADGHGGVIVTLAASGGAAHAMAAADFADPAWTIPPPAAGAAAPPVDRGPDGGAWAAADPSQFGASIWPHPHG